MDAKQKRRIIKTAITHLILSVFVALFPYLPFWSDLVCNDYFGYTLYVLWSFSFLLLQPAVLLNFGGIGLAFVLFPIWSLFFSWIFIRIKDWLNHFPILGKRVF